MCFSYSYLFYRVGGATIMGWAAYARSEWRWLEVPPLSLQLIVLGPDYSLCDLYEILHRSPAASLMEKSTCLRAFLPFPYVFKENRLTGSPLNTPPVGRNPARARRSGARALSGWTVDWRA